MNVRYLNLKTVAKQENLKKILIIIGMVVADFNLFGVALNIIDFSGFGLGFFGFHFAIGCLIFWWGLMVGKRIDFARRLETIFGSDQDGIVTIGEIATLMNKPGGKIRASMAGLFKKKYFVNCSFQRDPQPAVVIYDAINQDVYETTPREYKCKIYSGMLESIFDYFYNNDTENTDIFRRWLS